MHSILLTLLVLLNSSILVFGASVDICFDVKKGTEKGGCDMYRTGGEKKLDGYYDEAVKLINTASDAFGEYNSDTVIQRIAKSFFGIDPNEDLDGPKAGESEKILKHVQDWFKDLKKFVGGDCTKLPLFCDSTWLEQTKTVYTDGGVVVPGKKVEDLDAYGTQEPQLRDEESPWVAFWSPDLKEYFFGPPFASNPPTYCGDKLHIAVVTAMSTGKNQLSLTLCPNGFFNTKIKEKIEDSKTQPRTGLQSLQPKSLSIVHELVHVLKHPSETPDQIEWHPKRDIKPILANNNPNPRWPGATNAYVRGERPAYTATQAIFLALKTNPREPTEENPENYAWAALAVYLARNGAKKDYSTGILQDIPRGSKRPHSPDSQKLLLLRALEFAA